MDDPDTDWRFSGTSRDEEKIRALSVQGINMVAFDDPQLNFLVGDASHILVSTAPTDEGCPAFARIGNKIKPDTQVIYLSATSVYGNSNGAWVDETSLATSPSKRGKQRLLAEKSWTSKNATLLRLGAIYGPGRNVLSALMDGSQRLYVKEDHVFCRAHVFDIATVIGAVIEKGIKQEIFNVVDDTPSSQSDVIYFAASLLEQDPPKAEPVENAPLSVQAFYAENRRVKNEKMKSILGVTLKFPSYMGGLNSLVD